jgi:hypothetical protein
MTTWSIKKNGLIVNILTGEEDFIRSSFPTPEYEVEEVDLDGEPIHINTLSYSLPNWEGLLDTLRSTSMWTKVFSMACANLQVNALFTVLYGALISSHNMSDLAFSINAIRQIMIAASADFNQKELDMLRQVLEGNNFNPHILDIKGVDY